MGRFGRSGGDSECHAIFNNEMVFCGSPTHPRGMGPLIRLCLHYAIDLWFIPQSEPWRNGVVEQFNKHYQQKFLDRVSMQTADELREGALAFEQKHNSRYRYSKLNGKTPREERDLQRLLQRYSRYDLLILDELGYIPFSKEGAELLFQVLAEGCNPPPAP